MSGKKRKISVKKRESVKSLSANASSDIGRELQKAIGYHQSGQLENAQKIYNKIIKINPCHGDALHLLGVIAHQTRNNDAAISLIKKAIQNNPENPLYYYHLGKVLKAQGCLDSAISAFRKTIELKPDDAEAYLAMGNIYQAQKQTDDAVYCYQKAIQIKSDYTDAYNNLGAILKEKGHLDEAISCYNTALRLKPDDHEVYNNLGIALKKQGNIKEAIACYEKALQLKPDYADVYNNIGIALKDEGLLSEAIACYQKSLSLKPEVAETYNNMGIALKDQGKIDEAIACYHKALEIKPDYVSAHSNMLFALHQLASIDPAQLFDQHKQWAKQHSAPFLTYIPSHRNDKRGDRRLRVGYVSPDFKAHSVACFMEALLETHNRSDFEIWCYSDVAIKDFTTNRFEDLADIWRDISGAPDEVVAKWIRDDQIDILVDLAGHTANNRMLVFARKPAPIQVTYLGYPNTTGLDTVDYRITDPWTDPPGETDHLYTEKLVHLPHGFLCYTPYKDSPAIKGLPAETSNVITFGSFNNRAKITPEVVKVWSRLLSTVPNARLLLKSKSLSDIETQNMLQNQFMENNVSPEQLLFYSYSPSTYDHLDLYNRMDIGLDTFPYNGTTTTCEALWMGVPVIVLSGAFHMSRVGVSLLTHVGLTDWITSSVDEYIDKAVTWTRDFEKLKRIRSSLRDKMRRSPLLDAGLLTLSLENAYKTMWKHYVGEKINHQDERSKAVFLA